LQYAIYINATQAGPMSVLENPRHEAFAQRPRGESTLSRQIDRMDWRLGGKV
jgi:hypothetical protein